MSLALLLGAGGGAADFLERTPIPGPPMRSAKHVPPPAVGGEVAAAPTVFLG